jgi:hypothetical protein
VPILLFVLSAFGAIASAASTVFVDLGSTAASWFEPLAPDLDLDVFSLTRGEGIIDLTVPPPVAPPVLRAPVERRVVVSVEARAAVAAEVRSRR